MADGYARETGRIGVCCATTGPGATNLITGVACAYADHVPMLVITPQTPLPTFGLGPFQESSADAMDIVGMFEHCTRYNSLVTHPEQLEKKLAAALTVAMQTPKGPAHLSVPVEILRAPLAKAGENRLSQSIQTGNRTCLSGGQRSRGKALPGSAHDLKPGPPGGAADRP